MAFEHRIITNKYTFPTLPYYSKQYQIAREDAQPGMTRRTCVCGTVAERRVEGIPFYQGRYVGIGECAVKPSAASKATSSRKAV